MIAHTQQQAPCQITLARDKMGSVPRGKTAFSNHNGVAEIGAFSGSGSHDHCGRTARRPIARSMLAAFGSLPAAAGMLPYSKGCSP
jgi:hypothetical protein